MPSPPIEAVVPQPVTDIATALSALLVVVGLIWGLLIWRREGDRMPLLLGVGGAIASLLEPLYDITGAIWHPAIGQWTAFTLCGRSMPMLIPLAYCWNVGFGSACLYRWIAQGRIDRESFWKWLALAFALNFVFEFPGTTLGVYLYYGRQALPLTSGLYPLPIGIANAVAVLAVATLASRLRGDFRGGLRAWLLGWFITPAGFWAATGPGWIPQMIAVNSDNIPAWGVQMLGLISIGLSLGLAGILRSVLPELERTVTEPAEGLTESGGAA
jgi:hypothetical protein